MEATSLFSSVCLTGSSLVPLLCHQNLNHGRNVLSLLANPQRCSIATSHRKMSICPNLKASLKGNLEAAGVPASVPVRVAHELLQAGHRYLDVRTPEEFSAGHATGAINIPYMYRVGSGMKKNPDFVKEVSSHFGKYDEIIVGCQSGKRSLLAATDLLDVGFTAITDIAGGYAAWKQNELPTEE
ncbi:Rhodanese domain-containing protein [Cephalotus follicularis]|uniref:Rhodanese domain-containing protein n=1 Tax=Cephalotus follicularis TaxID=3775 RepID=A0A1Q3CEN2_CEPFO|nr:Rhodanese domain-containing protein [Cephalotus follicularis]